MQKSDEGKTASSKSDASVVYVPENCPTLAEAVALVEQNPDLTTIQLGEGNFTNFSTNGGFLAIRGPIEIRGAGMGRTILPGVEVSIEKWEPEEGGDSQFPDDAVNVFSNLTFDGTGFPPSCGGGLSSDFGSLPLRVENCSFLETRFGVQADSPASVVSCVFSGCGQGIMALATVTVSGEGTRISECTPARKDIEWYALWSRNELGSCIKIMTPLSIDIAFGNEDGKNFGGYGRIEIVNEEGFTVEVVKDSSEQPAYVTRPLKEARTQWDKH
jgi:hypothetical protein